MITQASRRTVNAMRTTALLFLCLVQFVLFVTIIGPPQDGLDPAWTQALTWGFLHDAQWGRGIVFTYGPLGFLGPYTSYVSGAFDLHAAGQILLSAAFALATGLILSRARLGLAVLFMLALLCTLSRLPGDIAWAMTLIFATIYLIDCCRRKTRIIFSAVVLLFAPAFAAIALTKFSLFPLWAICLVALAAACMIEHEIRCAVLALLAFPAALFAVWIACGQDGANLTAFLSSSAEIAAGYRRAMGLDAPVRIQVGALAMLGLFVAVCGSAGWRGRTDRANAIVHALLICSVLLFWLAFLTRGDHWPWFFSAMSLLPFALFRNGSLIPRGWHAGWLVTIVLTAATVGLLQEPNTVLRDLAYSRIRDGLRNLSHLAELKELRESQWRSAAEAAALPKIKDRVGKSRVDLLTLQLGAVLLNDFNYAPRPAFQSYLAYTPWIARLNESYFLGPDAPEFVLLKLDAVDSRFPTSEDGLALLALLRHYRPQLSEEGYLLLQRDAAVARTAPIEPPETAMLARIGADVAVRDGNRPTLAFIRSELNAFGKVYTALFREPTLNIEIAASESEPQRYRLVRSTAATGFMISPVVQSGQDWAKLYLSEPLPSVLRLRVDVEQDWQRWLFQPDISVSLVPIEILHADAKTAPAEVQRSTQYPGFNLAPESPSGLRVIEEGRHQSVFAHAPTTIVFRPPPGRYTISATFGMLDSAVHDAGCAGANADGIGVSVILRPPDADSVVWHGEIDPFHSLADRGPHQLRVEEVNIENGYRVDYRVDPGHGGDNTSCDWSYVRDLRFMRRGRAESECAAGNAATGAGRAPASRAAAGASAAGCDDILVNGFD